VKKFDNEYFMPGQLEPAPEEPKKLKKKSKRREKKENVKAAPKQQPSGVSPQTSIADKLREALLARMPA
jgi:hypothetical protein